jgi:hypothetical protein
MREYMTNLGCLGREELEGEGWLPFGPCLGEFLRDVHGGKSRNKPQRRKENE